MERIQLAKGAYLNLLPADKFKRCRITVQLRYNADRSRATALALLPFLMERGYADCPDPTALSRRLAKLYGASLTVDSTASGASRSLVVNVDGIRPEFALAGEDLAGEYAALALGVALRPALVNGEWPADEVEIEKKKLAQELAAEINDKRVFCLRQARRRFFGDSPAGIERVGYLEEVPGVTGAQVAEAWRWLVKTAEIEVFCSGLDGGEAARQVKNALEGVERVPARLAAPVAMPAGEVQQAREEMEMVQAKLCLLFTVKDFDSARDLSAMRIAMAVLGGSPTSRLFMNVREKQSLCYYCAASFNSFGGVMCIDSGVEPENAQKAQEAIVAEWRALCEEPVGEKELEDARRFTVNALAAVEDSISAQESWYVGQLWRGSVAPPQAVREELLAVTAADVCEQMKKFHLSVAYLLTRKEDEHE